MTAPSWLRELLPFLASLDRVRWDRFAGDESGGSVFGWVEGDPNQTGRVVLPRGRDFVNLVAWAGEFHLSTSSAAQHDQIVTVWNRWLARRAMQIQGVSEPWPELEAWAADLGSRCVRVESVTTREQLPNVVEKVRCV